MCNLIATTGASRSELGQISLSIFCVVFIHVLNEIAEVASFGITDYCNIIDTANATTVNATSNTISKTEVKSKSKFIYLCAYMYIIYMYLSRCTYIHI